MQEQYDLHQRSIERSLIMTLDTGASSGSVPNGDWDAYWKALAQSNPAVANDNNPHKSLRRIA
jgi:hypothetical protein